MAVCNAVAAFRLPMRLHRTRQEVWKMKFKTIPALYPILGNPESILNGLTDPHFSGKRMTEFNEICIDILALDMAAEKYLQRYIARKNLLLDKRERIIFPPRNAP